MTSRRRFAFELLRLEQRASARRLRIDGAEWLVYELVERDARERADASLVFESESTMRRVRQYPSIWRTLSDEELFALSWSR